jgi:hypothetical protein
MGEGRVRGVPAFYGDRRDVAAAALTPTLSRRERGKEGDPLPQGEGIEREGGRIDTV